MLVETGWCAVRYFAIFVFGNAAWLDSARRALGFIRDTMWKDGRLFATYKDGRAHLNAYLDELTPDTPHVLDAVVRSHRLQLHQAEGERPGAADEAEALVRESAGGSGEPLQQSLPRITLVLLDCGRREEAAALLGELFAFGDALVSILNDAPIVDAAWVAVDLGRADEFAALVEGRPHSPWAVAAAAICAGDFRRAADVAQEIGFRPGEAYARLRAARQLVEEGRRAEADVQLRRSLAFWREVGAKRYVREGEALLAASA